MWNKIGIDTSGTLKPMDGDECIVTSEDLTSKYAEAEGKKVRLYLSSFTNHYDDMALVIFKLQIKQGSSSVPLQMKFSIEVVSTIQRLMELLFTKTEWHKIT